MQIYEVLSFPPSKFMILEPENHSKNEEHSKNRRSDGNRVEMWNLQRTS